MKAHFIVSTLNLQNDISTYRYIIKALDKFGVKLTNDWLEETYKRKINVESFSNNQEVWQNIYKENINAISRADVIIAEVSKRSFLVGFQVAYALQMKKPILLLSKYARAPSASGVSLNEDIINFSRYNEKNIEKIITTFIDENSTSNRNIRFNFFINRKILNYLKWASFQTGQTKSEIIRNLLVKEIDKSNYK